MCTHRRRAAEARALEPQPLHACLRLLRGGDLSRLHGVAAHGWWEAGSGSSSSRSLSLSATPILEHGCSLSQTRKRGREGAEQFAVTALKLAFPICDRLPFPERTTAIFSIPLSLIVGHWCSSRGDTLLPCFRPLDLGRLALAETMFWILS